MNEVNIDFETAGWLFPFARTAGSRQYDIHGPTGREFSLGQVDVQSNKSGPEGRGSTGYCVVIVVDTSMGVK